MGRFTVYNNQLVDLQIERQLSAIVDVIVNALGHKVESIFLAGGFGRGEGSVSFINGENVLPLKDYDILVIVKKKPDSETVARICSNAYSALGFTSPEENIFRFSDFVIDIAFTTRKRFTSSPDIATYELKVASSLLYGTDIRTEIPWEISDIPLASGWRLLFEKMTGLIGHFPQKYLLSGRIDQRNKELLVYECYKTYVEIATALSLLMGCYAPSFLKRNKLFKDNFSQKLPKLHKKLPRLPGIVAKATAFKLKPRFEDVDEDPLDLWFTVRDDLLTVAQFYLERLLNVRINNFIESHALLLNKLKKKYFEHIASAMSPNLGRASNNFVDSCIQLYINFRYFSSVYSSIRIPYFRIFSSPFTAVTVHSHSVAPQVLLSIRKDGSIDERYFESAKDSLCRFSPYCKIESFEDLRTAYLTAYRHLPVH